jgi:hypothetical protein
LRKISYYNNAEKMKKITAIPARQCSSLILISGSVRDRRGLIASKAGLTGAFLSAE